MEAHLTNHQLHQKDADDNRSDVTWPSVERQQPVGDS